jgi:hypothetical protein
MGLTVMRGRREVWRDFRPPIFSVGREAGPWGWDQRAERQYPSEQFDDEASEVDLRLLAWRGLEAHLERGRDPWSEQAIVDLDLDLLAAIEPPRGYGRD